MTGSHPVVPAAAPPQRRLPALLAALVLAVAPMAVLAGTSWVTPAAAACPDGKLRVDRGGRDVCVHSDPPPRGVDVTKPVPTRTLKARVGAGRKAYEAAEALGVASPAPATAALPAVPCDGDGVSGNRVQAMYVVEADRPNRFDQLQGSFKLWAAGVDDVVNRSAAVTGGVRNVRYVTEPTAGGICEAKVLDVTVPDGALDSFSTTVSALQALGYTRADRKYLLWTDATVLCGVASLYYDDRDVITNKNNGVYAQYARVDTGCWGLGEAAGQHSTEAHELGHMLGGVQNTAPHSTGAGHCTDERDTLCYADSPQVTVTEVCAPAAEYLLDCNSDDYFHTAPAPGSYLDTHWNAADSSFLINGGSVDPGATFHASVGVNSPVVPGLSTQVSVTPGLVDGRTLREVEWSVDRADCAFSAPDQPQSALVCDATASGSAQVTARLTDSTGATTSDTAGVVLDVTADRDVQVSVEVDDFDADAGEMCTAEEAQVRATVVDVASGQPVNGLPVAVDKDPGTGPVRLGSTTTGPDGTAVVTDVPTTSTGYTARTAATTTYNAAASDLLEVAAVECTLPTTTSLTAAVDRSVVGHGDPVTVAGVLRSATGSTTTPVPEAPVVAVIGSGDAAVEVAAGVTDVDGRYSLSFPLTRSGYLTVRHPGGTDTPSATQSAGWLDAQTWNTLLSISGAKKGKYYTVTGTMHRYLSSLEPAPGRLVDVYFTAAGTDARQLLGTVTTGADGSYLHKVVARTLGSGEVVAMTRPSPGYRDATSGTLTVSSRK